MVAPGGWRKKKEQMGVATVVPLALAVGLAACATEHLNFSMQTPAGVNLKAKGIK